MKQYYGITQMIKVLIIVKKKKTSSAELILLFKTGLSRLLNKLSLISRIYLSCPNAKVLNSSNDGILFQIRRCSRITLFFDGLNFRNVKGDTPIIYVL